MTQQTIIKTSGDSSGTIDSLIEFLEEAKANGATHYKMYWSGDPMWAFKWFEAYKELSEEEIKAKKIAELEEEVARLKMHI